MFQVKNVKLHIYIYKLLGDTNWEDLFINSIGICKLLTNKNAFLPLPEQNILSWLFLANQNNVSHITVKKWYAAWLNNISAL